MLPCHHLATPFHAIKTKIVLTPPLHHIHLLLPYRASYSSIQLQSLAYSTNRMDEKEVVEHDYHQQLVQQHEPLMTFLLRPASWFPKLIEAQVDLITNAIPFLSSTTAFEPKDTVSRIITSAHHESSTTTNARTSSAGSSQLLKKVGYGLLGVAHMCTVLTAVMAVAVVLGIGVVKVWVEEPVVVKEKLYFDYTAVNPEAVFVFGNRGGGGRLLKRPGSVGVPVGQTVSVSLELVLPESDFNREMGVFQVTTEIVSTGGEILARSSQPCMLRYRSQPLRLMRSLTMGIPLLLGIASETQELTMKEALKYKEARRPRAESIRVTLTPRAGTPYLPQLYESEIRVQSQLTWRKKLVYDWRRTLYVCASMYVYGMILSVLLCCFRSVVFPVFMTRLWRDGGEGEVQEGRDVGGEEMELSEKLRKQFRKERKGEYVLRREFPGFGGVAGVSSRGDGVAAAAEALSYAVSKDDSGVSTEEGVSDSESVCL